MGKNKKSEEEFKWVCLSISERYSSHLYFQKVEEHIKKIFGSDQKNILFIGNDLEDGVIENMLETYVFVLCRNVHKYLPAIEKSKYIRTILNSIDNVIYINPSDIETLKNDWANKKVVRNEGLFFGDVVDVKYGVYQNLNGIILDFEDNVYMVLFKFCFGYRLVKLNVDNLVKVNNIFEFIKVPCRS